MAASLDEKGREAVRLGNEASHAGRQREAEALWQKADRIPADASAGLVAVEVKTFAPSSGDVVRQINLYREYLYASLWVLAVPEPINSSDEQHLLAQEIHTVVLSSFPRWLEDRKTQSNQSTQAVSI